MALSGSYNFSQNRDSLIKDCLVSAGVIRDDETPTGTMNASATRLAERMLKAWSAHGLQLWAHEDAILFLEDGKRLYTLGTSGDRWIIKNDASETKLNGALSSGATAVTVDSTTGMAASDVIGIEIDGNIMHWDTITSVDTSTTLTLTTGIADDAVDNAYVVAYTSKAPKPYRIVDGYIIRYAEENSHIPLNIISRNEYYSLHQKTTEATPISILFIPRYDDATIEVWPTSDASNHRIIVSAQFPFDDLDAATSNIYFPDYWYDAIHANLTYRLFLDYHRFSSSDTYAVEERALRRRAEDSLTLATDYDVENTYIQFEPEIR